MMKDMAAPMKNYKYKISGTMAIFLLGIALFSWSCGENRETVEKDMGLVAHFTVEKQSRILLQWMEENPDEKSYTLRWGSKIGHKMYEKKMVYSPAEKTLRIYENMMVENSDWRLVEEMKDVDLEKMRQAVKDGFFRQTTD